MTQASPTLKKCGYTGVLSLCLLCLRCSSAVLHEVSSENTTARSKVSSSPKANLENGAAWTASDFRSTYTQIPASLLSDKKPIRFFTRVYRVLGNGILPLQQQLIDIQAQVAASHCPLLGYSCRAYLTSSSAAAPYTFRELLQLKQEAPRKLCQTVCIVQIFPLPAKEAVTDCPACMGLQPELGFQQFDIAHAMMEVSINQESYIPTTMRLRWFPTTAGPQLAAGGLERVLPSLEEHIIHDPALAQHMPQWLPHRAMCLVFQLHGPNVAPMTAGKQNLIVHTLQQLEKHFFVVNQFFRMANCSHDVELQQATVSMIVVTSTGSTDVGLDTVIVSHSQLFQESLQGAGLNVTSLTITGPVPQPDETVADQIACLLGPPSLWEQVRPIVMLMVVACTAIPLAATAFYYAATTMKQLPQALATLLISLGFADAVQGGNREHQSVDKYARLLNVDLHTGPQVERADLEICRLPDGKLWVLGSGACGTVYKAMRDGVQDVALKVLTASHADAIQLRALKKEIRLLRLLSYDPNMVQFYGACLDPGFPMLVLEYMEGGDLLSCIQQDCYPIPAGQFTWYSKGGHIARDVAKGITFLHKRKVVHNDIKSKNILLTKDATVAKIADVGTSRILETTSTTLSCPMLCTFAYAAPEQLMGGRDACTDKVDIFSFGVVLWEIATQEVPRRGFLRKTRVPSECPQIIEDLISACLSAQPSDRPTAIQAYQIITSTLHLSEPLGETHDIPLDDA